MVKTVTSDIEGVMPYYARFELIQGHVFRFDTRIYLGQVPCHEEGECVGAVVGKNPGSAKPTQLDVLAPLSLAGDKMLPSVRNRFLRAYERAGRLAPRGAFVRVWNLFYLCNPNLTAACSSMSRITNVPVCPSEGSQPKVVWFAWGGADRRIDAFKQRFGAYGDGCFYYDHHRRTVVSGAPAVGDFAKHPQGMPAEPLVRYLAGVL